MDMEPVFYIRWRRDILIVLLIFLILPFNLHASDIPWVTASIGQPNRGKLINGIPFPEGLGGYKLRCVRRSYTTPEVIGGVLAAIFTVKEKYPNTCDLKIGDFSLPRGGRFWPHKSHQNGRDVDIGMYAKHNMELPGLVRMTPRTIDAAKTWTLVESLLRSQNIKYMFLDMRLQRVLCKYALKHGVDKKFLKKSFQWASGCRYTAIIRHDGEHSTHIHVRFKTPWSEIAGKRWGHLTKEDLYIIAACQEGYLPHEYFYTAKKAMTLAEISKYLGIKENLVKEWNHFQDNRIVPGTTIKVYKVGYKPLGNIMLARFLRPEIFPSPEHRITWPSMYSSMDIGFPLSLKLTKNVVKTPRAIAQSSVQTKTVFYWIKPGDTLSSIARKYGVSIYDLCKWNGLNKNRTLSIGKRIRIYTSNSAVNTRYKRTSIGRTKSTCCSLYVVRKGDSLWRISRELGVPISSLCKLNNISTKTILRPGRKLRWCKGTLKIRKTRVKRTTNSDNKRQIAVKNNKSSTSQKGQIAKYHIIKSGDTLWTVARRYGVSVKELCKWNNIKPTTTLRIGRKLKIYRSTNNNPSYSSLINSRITF